MSKHVSKVIEQLKKEKIGLGSREEVEEYFGLSNIKDFPKDFDVEDIGELNTCNKCGNIQNPYTEMYWQGEECQETNEILEDYTAVCDECFDDLMKAKNYTWNKNNELIGEVKQT